MQLSSCIWLRTLSSRFIAQAEAWNWSSKLTEDFFPVRIVRSFWMCLHSATQVVLSLVRCQNGQATTRSPRHGHHPVGTVGKAGMLGSWCLMVFEDSFCCQKTSPVLSFSEDDSQAKQEQNSWSSNQWKSNGDWVRCLNQGWEEVSSTFWFQPPILPWYFQGQQVLQWQLRKPH